MRGRVLSSPAAHKGEPSKPKTAPSRLSSRSCCIVTAQVLALAFCCRCNHEADNETIKSQRLGKDQNQDHPDEQARLLRICTYTCIAHDANGEAGSQGAHANC